MKVNVSPPPKIVTFVCLSTSYCRKSKERKGENRCDGTIAAALSANRPPRTHHAGLTVAKNVSGGLGFAGWAAQKATRETRTISTFIFVLLHGLGSRCGLQPLVTRPPSRHAYPLCKHVISHRSKCTNVHACTRSEFNLHVTTKILRQCVISQMEVDLEEIHLTMTVDNIV